MTSVLSRIINSNAKVELLGYLLDRPELEMTVSDLSRISELPKSTVALIVEDWWDAALVNTRTQGKNKLVKVNPHCSLLIPLKKLLEANQHHLNPLVKRIARMKTLQDKQVKAVVVFGSRARGTHQGRSDLDVLVVLERESGSLHGKIIEESIKESEITGIRIAPLVLKKSAFVSRIAEGDQLVKNILTEGRIVKGEDFIGNIRSAQKSRTRPV